MEQLLLYFQDVRIVASIVATIAVIIGIAVAKKAFKLCAVLFMFGAVFSLIGPGMNQVLENNGITMKGTVLTIASVDNQTYTVDISSADIIDLQAQEDGTYLVTISAPDMTPSKFVVSADAAKWVETCVNFLGGVVKAGSDFASNTIKPAPTE